MECGAGRGGGPPPYRASAGARAAVRTAARRQADPGERRRQIGQIGQGGRGTRLAHRSCPRTDMGRRGWTIRRTMKLADLLTADAVSDARLAALEFGGVSA